MEQASTKKDRFPIFRQRLGELMGDMTTTEFAEKVGLTRQTMGFYLNGDRIPDSFTLAQICKECNVSADWMIGLTNDPSRHPCAADEIGLSPKAIEHMKLIVIMCFSLRIDIYIRILNKCFIYKNTTLTKIVLYLMVVIAFYKEEIIGVREVNNQRPKSVYRTCERSVDGLPPLDIGEALLNSYWVVRSERR